MRDGTGLDLGPLLKLCGTRCVISDINRSGVRHGRGHTKRGAGFGCYHSGVCGNPCRYTRHRINRKRAAALSKFLSSETELIRAEGPAGSRNACDDDHRTGRNASSPCEGIALRFIAYNNELF